MPFCLPSGCLFGCHLLASLLPVWSSLFACRLVASLWLLSARSLLAVGSLLCFPSGRLFA
eukprot:1546601-Pleurochrysis_carterae.AAC.1